MLLKRGRRRSTLGAIIITVGSVVFLLFKLYTVSNIVNSLSAYNSRRGLVVQHPGVGFRVQKPDKIEVPDVDFEPTYLKAEDSDEDLASLYAEDFRADQGDLEAESLMVDAAESKLHAEPGHDGSTAPEGGDDGVDDEENEGEAVEDGDDVKTQNEDDDEDDNSYSPLPDGLDYREIFSMSTADRKFIPIFTGGANVYNPNIIPHPTAHDLWIIVAQHEQSALEISVSEQMSCSGGIMNGVMVCTAEPVVLPIEPSIHGKCEDDLAYYNFRSGPRDARMVYGPDAPYIVYGSQSAYTCLGIWLQDVRMLLQDFSHEKGVLTKLFTQATELQRPPPIKGIEKNFFLFWDREGKAYAHHDIHPRRVFAQISFDGSVGPNLGSETAYKDEVCLTTYMPTLAPTEESIHQASNSLSITLCKRKDPGCIPDATNTFVFTIFQHKSYHDWHGIYEPYIMLFQQDAPFAIHAISQRPLWIHGRAPLTKDTHSLLYDSDPNKPIPDGHTEMFYVTSISWKTHGQKYHGYLDDPLFLAFGIEDTRAGVIDILAEDLFQDLGRCA